VLVDAGVLGAVGGGGRLVIESNVQLALARLVGKLGSRSELVPLGDARRRQLVERHAQVAEKL
jgi:hypothetical protein